MNYKLQDKSQTAATPQGPFRATVVADRSTEKGVRRLRSSELFGGTLEVEIEHNGSVYRLRKTSLGKLILTK